MITLAELNRLARKPLEWVLRPGPLDTPCWIWQGALTKGYPRRGAGKHNVYELVHRVHLEEHLGIKLESHIQAHHICETKACVNPDHLQALTRAEHRTAHRSRNRFRVLDTSGTSEVQEMGEAK